MTHFSEGRDPANPSEMRLSLLRWLDSRDQEHDHDQATRDEADIAFEADLLTQGVINPSESVQSIHRNFWQNDPTGLPSSVNVMINTEDGRTIMINLNRATGLLGNVWEV